LPILKSDPAEFLNVILGKDISDEQVALVPEFWDVHADIGMHGRFL
jgi:hypothetical protein